MHRVLVHKDGKVVTGRLSDLKTSSTVWVDITQPTDQELAELQKFTEIEPEYIHEWLAGKKRASALDFQKYSVVIFLAPLERVLKTGRRMLTTEPCVMLISHDRNDFITIHGNPLHAIQEMESYSEKHKVDIFTKRATFLLFTLLDEIIEHYFDSLDFINATVQKAESLAFNVHPEINLMQQILTSKKTIIYFHKALITNREVITTIEQEHLSFLDDELSREFRILSSSLMQLVEINSTYRDILNTATEIHLSVISNNLNTIMKKITSWGAIILLPSLVAGIFGMNFKHFSVFDWEYGLEFSLVTMVASVFVLYWFFRKKDWL